MNLQGLLDLELPLTNPVLKFLLILIIILSAPLLLNKVKIPALLGLIIAGAIIGPNGFNLMVRDSSIILSGTAGLLYIMFLAGLEIDMADFRKNAWKSTTLGLYGFIIPMVIGTLISLYVLEFSMMTSLLLASMFSSHTLITYPMVSKLGIIKNQAVNITVGSTMITNTLSLLVLAVIVGLTSGTVDHFFYLNLAVSFLVFSLIVMLLFPLIGRWFFKRVEDNVSQYIFVLVIVFSGAFLAELAGIEAIIGAFLAGLALNRLVPRTSPLMNRIDFVGNVIFIPFFLIGVGMLIDYKAFFTDFDTFKVAMVMTIVATLGKFLAAWLTQKTFHYTGDERQVIFGLSNSQAAATLAAVLIGYNIILGETATGEPIRLLDESVLNGTILMILITCTIASFVTQKAAQKIALTDVVDAEGEETTNEERILIPVTNLETTDELVNLGLMTKSPSNKTGLYALNVINSKSADSNEEKEAHKILKRAASTAAATDNHLTELLRYDVNIVNGITGVVKEQRITDLILGLHVKKNIADSFLGHLTEGILSRINATTMIYKGVQPLATIKRHVVVIPEKAEKEVGFPFWLVKVWNISRSTGARLVFYAHISTLEYLQDIQQQHPVESSFNEFNDWEDFLILAKSVRRDDNLIIVLSRKDHVSYDHHMSKIPAYLDKYFQSNSFTLIYPMQAGVSDAFSINLKNPSFMEPLQELDDLGKTIGRLFRRR